MPIQPWLKSLGKWPLPCQMVFVLRPLTQTQQTADETDQDYKYKSRLVMCGNFAAWREHSTTTTNLDAPLLRLMLSLACAPDTTGSSIDIASAFLNADIHEEDAVLVTLPPILVKMNIAKPKTVWRVKRAIYGLREAPHLWQKERDQKLRELEFTYNDKLALLVQSHIHPSLWFIAEGAVAERRIPPFDHHRILGYVAVYVDDLLIAGPRPLTDTVVKAVQNAWKTSQPEHLGPDPDCVPILRFLGMNLERVGAERSKELSLPVGSILLNPMEFIEVLMKFEPSLQLKTQTTPGNQESFATRPTTAIPTDEDYAEHLTSLQALVQEEIVEIDALEKKNTKLHSNSEQNLINLPAIVGCLSWIALRNQSRHCMCTQSSRKFDYSRSRHLFHSSQTHLSISTSHSGLCIAICSNTSLVQAQVVGTGRCLLCSNRGDESTRTERW